MSKKKDKNIENKKNEPKKVEGRHYDLPGVETIDVIESVIVRENIPRPAAYCIGNAIKYLLRCGIKNGENWKDDIAKAENYLHRAISGKWMEIK